MISFKYALDFEGFKQDSSNKNILNVTFAGVEQPFARYNTNHFQWELQSGVPNSEAFYGEVTMVTSFSGCASVASRIIKEKIIVDEIISGLKVVEEFFLSLKHDHRKFFELDNELSKEIISMSALLNSLVLQVSVPIDYVSEINIFIKKTETLIVQLKNNSIGFEQVSDYYSGD